MSFQRICQSQIDVITNQLREVQQTQNDIRESIIGLQHVQTEFASNIEDLCRKLLSLTNIVTNQQTSDTLTAPVTPHLNDHIGAEPRKSHAADVGSPRALTNRARSLSDALMEARSPIDRIIQNRGDLQTAGSPSRMIGSPITPNDGDVIAEPAGWPRDRDGDEDVTINERQDYNRHFTFSFGSPAVCATGH